MFTEQYELLNVCEGKEFVIFSGTKWTVKPPILIYLCLVRYRVKLSTTISLVILLSFKVQTVSPISLKGGLDLVSYVVNCQTHPIKEN